MLLIIITFFNSFASLVKAYNIQIGEKTKLCKERELFGLIQYKSNKSLKLVMRVYYKDPKTGERLEAFCIEPEKPRCRYWWRR